MGFPFPIPDGELGVLCVGESLVDMIASSHAERLADVDTFERHAGGSPANIASYVARLGTSAALISKTGTGPLGAYLAAELRAAGVAVDYIVRDPDVATSVVFVSRTSETPEFEALRHADYLLEAGDVPEEAVARSQVVHASTFALSRRPSRDAVDRALGLAADHGKVVSLDPNYSPVVWPDRGEALAVLAEMLGRTDMTKPSLDDCRRLFDDQEAPETYVERFHELGPSVVVLTMGRDGVLLSIEGAVTRFAASPIDVRDATGAGDAFWAGFLVAFLDGNAPPLCLRFAQAVAARKLKVVGHLSGRIDKASVYRGDDA